MAYGNMTTVVGNMTRDPKLTFTPNGTAVTEFGIAINNRKKQGNEWVDGDPQFFDIVCWKQLAENVAESLEKGNRVIITGRLSFRQWEDKEGGKRSKVEIVADSVGPDLAWATAQVVKNERREGAAAPSGGGYGGGAAYDPDEEPFSSVEMGDHWHEV